MELTDKEIHLLTELSRARGLYAECKGVDLDALQELGLLEWFDARSSNTPFKEDPRPLFKLLGIPGRIDYFWVAPAENWRALVGSEVSAKVGAVSNLPARQAAALQPPSTRRPAIAMPRCFLYGLKTGTDKHRPVRLT
jgi:hypothetical protein